MSNVHVRIGYAHPCYSAETRDKVGEPAERYQIMDQCLKPINRQRSVPTELDEVALRNVKKQTRVHRVSDGQGTPLRLTLANIRGALRSTARP